MYLASLNWTSVFYSGPIIVFWAFAWLLRMQSPVQSTRLILPGPVSKLPGALAVAQCSLHAKCVQGSALWQCVPQPSAVSIFSASRPGQFWLAFAASGDARGVCPWSAHYLNAAAPLDPLILWTQLSTSSEGSQTLNHSNPILVWEWGCSKGHWTCPTWCLPHIPIVVSMLRTESHLIIQFPSLSCLTIWRSTGCCSSSRTHLTPWL